MKAPSPLSGGEGKMFEYRYRLIESLRERNNRPNRSDGPVNPGFGRQVRLTARAGGVYTGTAYAYTPGRELIALIVPICFTLIISNA
jgi:hypothetical protein